MSQNQDSPVDELTSEQVLDAALEIFLTHFDVEDDYDIYDFLSRAGYVHRSVNHLAGEYARGCIHCNTAEAIWSLLRPYLRTFRGVSKVYLPLYVAVFEFRYNHRHLITWQQAGVLLQRLFQADGAEIRKVVRENSIIEYCQLPT